MTSLGPYLHHLHQPQLLAGAAAVTFFTLSYFITSFINNNNINSDYVKHEFCRINVYLLTVLSDNVASDSSGNRVPRVIYFLVRSNRLP